MTARSGLSSPSTAAIIIAVSVAIGLLVFQLPVSPNAVSTPSGGCSAANISVAATDWERGDLRLVVANRGNKSLDGLNIAGRSTDGLPRAEDSIDQNLSPGNTVSVTLDVAGPVKAVKVYSNDCSRPVATHPMTTACPPGMALIDVSEVNQSTVDTSDMNDFCIFKYEASRQDATASREGNSTTASSQQGVVPWANIVQNDSNGISPRTGYNVSREDASDIDAFEACQNAGYELVSNKQWQAATMAERGQPETFLHGNTNWGKANTNPNETCTDDPTQPRDTPTDSGRCLTGTGPHGTWCTEQGVCDLVGNVAEWTSDFYGQWSSCDVVSMENIDYGCSYESDNQYNINFYYPDSWNATAACPASVSTCEQENFGSEYYSPPDDGPDGAVQRGGFWGHKNTAGPWHMILYLPPSAWGTDLGFRCALG